MQLGHLKLSGYGLLSTQGVQNRSQNIFSIFIYLDTICFIIGGGSKKMGRAKGVNVQLLLPTTATYARAVCRAD